MTYSSGSPAPMTPPAAKLADSKWRYLNSWWVLLPPLSLGFLSWLAFLIPAIRTGRWTFWVPSAVYGGLLVAATVANSTDKEGVGGTIAVLILLLGCWLGASIHAAVANRSYLRALAARSTWYDAPAPHHAPQTGPQTGPQTAPQPFLGISQDDYYAPAAPGYSATPTVPPPSTPPPSAPPTTTAHAPEGRIDLSSATPQQLAAVPGVGESLAQRIIEIRDARGGYRDLDDLVVAANLQPHELVRLRDRLEFGPVRPTGSGSQPGGTGRILDI